MINSRYYILLPKFLLLPLSPESILSCYLSLLRAAILNYRRLDGLSNRHLFLTVPEAGKSQDQSATMVRFSGACCLLAVSSPGGQWANSLVSAYKGTDPITRTHLSLIPPGLPLHYRHTEDDGFNLNLGEDTNIQAITLALFAVLYFIYLHRISVW